MSTIPNKAVIRVDDGKIGWECAGMDIHSIHHFDHWVYDRPIFGQIEIWTILGYLIEQGHDLDHLLRGTSLRDDALVDPADNWFLSDQAAIHRAVSRVGGDAMFVEIGRRLHLASYGVPGLAVLSSTNVGAALTTMQRFAPLFGFKERVSLVARSRNWIELQAPVDVEDEVACQFLLLDLVKLLTFLRDLAGPATIPSRLGIGDFGDANWSALAEHAGIAIERTSTGPSRIYLEPRLLSRPLRQASPAAHRKAVEASQRLISCFRARMDVRFRVLERMRDSGTDIPSSSQIALDLGMSDRTLRRRLEKTGASYSMLLEERRKQLAKRLLRNGETVEEIADHLGYSDPANFRHAFKRWTGQAPSFYRSFVRLASANGRPSSMVRLQDAADHPFAQLGRTAASNKSANNSEGNRL